MAFSMDRIVPRTNQPPIFFWKITAQKSETESKEKLTEAKHFLSWLHFSASGVSIEYAEVHAGWTGLDRRPDEYLNRAKNRRQLTNCRGSCTPEEMCFFSWHHWSHAKEAMCERFFLLNVGSVQNPVNVYHKHAACLAVCRFVNRVNTVTPLGCFQPISCCKRSPVV